MDKEERKDAIKMLELLAQIAGKMQPCEDDDDEDEEDLENDEYVSEYNNFATWMTGQQNPSIGDSLKLFSKCHPLVHIPAFIFESPITPTKLCTFMFFATKAYCAEHPTK